MKKILTAILVLTLSLAICAAASAATVAVDTTLYKSGILRAEPDLDADILDYVRNGTSVTATAKSGDWYAVTTAEGLSGYMHKSILSLADASDSSDVYSVNQAANLRGDASSDSQYVRGLNEGDTFLLIERGSSWSRVIYGGKTGYIHNSVYDK